MDGRTLLRAQFEQGHQFLDMTIAGVSDELAAKRFDGANINTIGQIYAHIALAEDYIVGTARGSTVFESGDWAKRTGLSTAAPRQSEEWASAAIDLPTYRAYMADVAKATDDFLATAEDAVLNRQIETPIGEMAAIQFMAGIGLGHVAGHWGEIAALKGIAGEKGLPF